MFSNVEFRKIETNQYKLSQAADLICTVEAIAQKNILTKSESTWKSCIEKPVNPRKLKKYTSNFEGVTKRKLEFCGDTYGEGDQEKIS